MHYCRTHFLSEETKTPRDKLTAWGHTGSAEWSQGDGGQPMSNNVARLPLKSNVNVPVKSSRNIYCV